MIPIRFDPLLMNERLAALRAGLPQVAGVVPADLIGLAGACLHLVRPLQAPEPTSYKDGSLHPSFGRASAWQTAEIQAAIEHVAGLCRVLEDRTFSGGTYSATVEYVDGKVVLKPDAGGR